MNNLWYQVLNKPPLTPPAVYFPIAWGILYTLMALAFVIVLYKPATKDKHIAIYMFLTQLFFNVIWSYLFFELKSVEWALLDVLVLLITVIITTIYFFKVSKVSGFLMIPYVLQVLFALYLNSGIKVLN